MNTQKRNYMESEMIQNVASEIVFYLWYCTSVMFMKA